MRKTMMTMIAAALGLATLAPLTACAGPAPLAPPVASGRALHTVQYWGAGPQHPWDDGWERRRQWREWRRERDEARIAEAARREAWQIEREREERRAWRRAMRGQHYGYGPVHGYYRSW